MTNWELTLKLFGFWITISLVTSGIRHFTSATTSFWATVLNFAVSIFGTFITTALYYAIIIQLVIYLLTEVA